MEKNNNEYVNMMTVVAQVLRKSVRPNLATTSAGFFAVFILCLVIGYFLQLGSFALFGLSLIRISTVFLCVASTLLCLRMISTYAINYCTREADNAKHAEFTQKIGRD
jgi:predicted RND superfamily exporter protein